MDIHFIYTSVEERRVALYVKSNIQSVLMTDFKTNHDIESVWVDILMFNKSYRIGAFYRPPGQSQELDAEIVKEIETACHNKEKGIVKMGDFNFPGIQWDSLSNTDHSSSVFINCILAVSYTHLRAHETPEHLVCRLLLEKKKKKKKITIR